MAEKFYIKNPDGCHNLINGIVIQAAKDYAAAYKVLKKKVKPGIKPKSVQGFYLRQERARNMLGQCEDFFRSEWFQQLTTIDGETILYYIRKNTNNCNIFDFFATFLTFLYLH